jgi:RHS repeat-associated protein
MQNINGTWTPSFYGYDGQGHVRFLTNSAGSATDTYDYDGYGNLIASTGSTPNVYRYRGEEWDSEVSLYNLRARWYNPATGRFLSRDPLDGGNKYAYAGSDPVNLSDPSGQGVLELISPFQAVLAAATVIAGSQVAVNIYNKNHGTSSYSFNPVGASFVCIMGASNYLLQKAGQAAVLTLVQVNGQSCKRDQRKTTAPPVPEPEPEPDPKPKPKPIPKPIGIGDEPPDCPNPLPIYIVPDVFPNIRRANWTAITIIDKPSILTRCSACEPQNRKDIRKRLTSLRNNNQVPTIDHVHEYPYASTAEGGSGAFLEVVPGSENSLEGNFLKIWLNAHGVWEGCQFQVLPILGAQ